MEWQPIETSPKDGTWVLLYGGETTEDDYCDAGVFKSRPVVGKYSEEYDDILEASIGSWDICYWDGDWRTGYAKPTHWMPLPAAPPKEK